MNARELKELGDHLFGKKAPINSLWQDIADQCYYERANYTLQRSIGMDFAANSMTSFPAMCRRDLGNAFGTMLRPVQKPWFHTSVRNSAIKDNETRQYLQAFEQTQRRAMYDPRSKFSRATKEGDHDFASVGQCAISIELNRDASGMLYRCWHLKDMCWQENEDGDIGPRFRRWKPPSRVLLKTFGEKKLHKDTIKHANDDPYYEEDVMHIVVEGDMYDDDAKGRPWWSIWYDVAHDALIDAQPAWTAHYRIPRWQTVSGSQYSYSPATVVALPDCRVIQAMTFTLLEAGEKAVNPPMVATIDAVRSDVSVYAGGITWIDPQYDERTGEALRPMQQDFRGFNFGPQMNNDIRMMLTNAFFLNKLTQPTRGPEMTAYEVSQRVQQYIRDALPIFEPMEMEYNAGICEDTFELLWRNGAFGSPMDWPKSLRGADIAFTFESPLHDAIEEQKGQLLIQGVQLATAVQPLDPTIVNVLDAKESFRDALYGIGFPATWLRNEDQVQAITDAQMKEAQAQKTLAALTQSASAAKDLGAAHASVAGEAVPA